MHALYVVACLVAPLAWGLVSYVIARWVEAKLPKPVEKAPKKPGGVLPDLEYYL
jgi:hypothetical protein